MPKREDERLRNLNSKHPEACTCQDCTEKSLKKRESMANRLFRKKKRPAEKVKRHRPGCDCVSCSLLTSIDFTEAKQRNR